MTPPPVVPAHGPSPSAADRAPRLQVVVAHPDDETFGCGALLLHARAAGVETFVTCATRGEAGEDRLGRRGSELGAVRAAELRSAGALLGVGDVELLDFVDSGMTGQAPEGSLVRSELAEVVSVLTTSLRRVRPDVVVTLDASDGHRDHQLIREATLLAATEAGVDTVYVSCLPQSLMLRWAEHVRAHRPDAAHVRDGERVLGTPDAEISTVVDVRDHRTQLALAMAAHASQESPYDVLPRELHDAFLDVARARRVSPPWDGATLEHDLGWTGGRGAVPSTTSDTARPGRRSGQGRPGHGDACWWDHRQARWACRCAGAVAGPAHRNAHDAPSGVSRGSVVGDGAVATPAVAAATSGPDPLRP